MKTILFTLIAVVLLVAEAAAQDGLLLSPPNGVRGQATLQNSSFLYQTLPPEALARPLEKHSIITVLVDYRTVVQSEGSSESRRRGNYNSILTSWLKFDGRNVSPAPLNNGPLAVTGTLDSNLIGEADIEQRETLTFTMSASIVEIRPNGNLVIEGRRRVRVNEEVWMTYLTGTVPRQLIGPDWVVRDSAIADLRIEKYEEGAVRDGSSRGWLARLYGKYKAF